jgi:hypothetical protein
MNSKQLLQDIVAKYKQHGWELRRVLLSLEGCAQFNPDQKETIEGVSVEQSDLNALWFSRASHDHREAWELRLLAETAYALFETFEDGEPEDLKKEALAEMEARMREYIAK